MTTSKQETQPYHICGTRVYETSKKYIEEQIYLSPLYTITLKSSKIREQHGSGRPKKITANVSRALGQYIRRDSSISTRTLATKLSNTGIEVSYRTVGRHLAGVGYLKNLPKATPMLTVDHKRKRVEWAKKHLNDNWKKTLFSDETAF